MEHITIPIWGPLLKYVGISLKGTTKEKCRHIVAWYRYMYILYIILCCCFDIFVNVNKTCGNINQIKIKNV